MELTRRAALGAIAATGVLGRLRAQPPVIRIGVLTDLSGPYSSLSGPDGVAAARQAAAEFMSAVPSVQVEVVAADHQNKPDVGAGILRNWYDQGDVDVVTDLTNSAVALAANNISAEKNKVCLVTVGGSSTLTGAACTPNLVHWTYDSWSLAHSTTTALVKTGGSAWYFVGPDYAYGKTLVSDATKFVERAGGRVMGSALFPFPETTDFSAYVVRAQSSGANVIAFASGGADLVNFIKQAYEFGVTGTAKIAAMTGFITDVQSVGVQIAQGMMITENFYWDLNDRTRGWTTRMRPHLPPTVIPNSLDAGDYAGPLHYLKAVKELGVTQAKASGRDAVAMMKKIPTDDDCFGKGAIRADGRKIHPAYLFEVKRPEDVRGFGDLYRLAYETPAAQAFRPMGEGGCPLIKA
ncbi:MAG TPA: ABC transporter substrate-binding protein [Rhodopila sp.]|jgi:branched-chain amino acid transport system substrate-binding protein